MTFAKFTKFKKREIQKKILLPKIFEYLPEISNISKKLRNSTKLIKKIENHKIQEENPT